MCLSEGICNHVNRYEQMKDYSIMANTMANNSEIIAATIYEIVNVSYHGMSEKEVCLIVNAVNKLKELSDLYTNKSDEYLSKYYSSYENLTSSIKQSFFKEGLLCWNQQ